MKNYITIRILQETKDKVEYIRCYKSMKEKKMISLNEIYDEIIDEYMKNHNIKMD